MRSLHVRRLPLALAVLTVLLGGLAVWFAGRADAVRGRAGAANVALTDPARTSEVTGQVYTVVGNKIAVWTQPREVRAMYNDGRWEPEQISARLMSTVKTEPLPFFAMVAGRREAAAKGDRPNA